VGFIEGNLLCNFLSIRRTRASRASRPAHHVRAGEHPAGLFDGVEDFDAATLDPSTGNMQAEFLPNSQFTQLPWDYLHPNRAGYNKMGLVVDILPFAPAHHHHGHD
jgi:hypothetical protein